jgi:uncharacterized membrane protein
MSVADGIKYIISLGSIVPEYSRPPGAPELRHAKAALTPVGHD